MRLHPPPDARRVLFAAFLATCGLAISATPGSASPRHHHPPKHSGPADHIVVIYQENHSFDNLYGRWQKVNGLAAADASHTTQVNQAGAPFACLKQNDPSLTSPPLSATCNDAANGIASHFGNSPFRIDDFIGPTATTCPGGKPGGCTRDLVHRYYQEQYQLDGGRQDRYVTGSDAIGLTMGTYDTTQLPIYAYLHGGGHPKYAIADNFFQPRSAAPSSTTSG